MRIPLFRIWYSTTYTTLLIVLLLLLCVSPGDIIYQSIKTREIPKLFIIGGVYAFTALIVILIYSTRIYTNRSVLQAIPKPYVPVEEGEIGKMVRRMIVKHLRRSAIVAWDSRPRDVREECEAGDDTDEEHDEGRPGTSEKEKDAEKSHKKRSGHGVPDATILPISAKSPPWGHVSHPGWASPASPDLPNLQYWSVICELPNLIEAKAVSLAPPDPTIETGTIQFPHETPLLPDAQIVTLLQRPRAMGLRSYLARLSSLGLLNPPTLGPIFLSQYEHARFSTTCLSETQFNDLMSVFADILNGMTELDPDVVEDLRAESIYSETPRAPAVVLFAVFEHKQQQQRGKSPFPTNNAYRTVASNAKKLRPVRHTAHALYNLNQLAIRVRVSRGETATAQSEHYTAKLIDELVGLGECDQITSESE
ncbi:hypothetical protein N0V94_001273 [Neodidymelliopsis sp. IMI 364377]|nr:hypothetical protein N0V94_001273 [Neodidymelliopsis sp. IMI 364377]